MKQIMHELRVSFVDTDTDNQTLQNCFNHSITLETPGKFESGMTTISGTGTYTANNLHYIYVTSETEFRFVVNGDEELIGRHFSYMNLENTFNIIIENVETLPEVETTIKYMHGVILDDEDEDE